MSSSSSTSSTDKQPLPQEEKEQQQPSKRPRQQSPSPSRGCSSERLIKVMGEPDLKVDREFAKGAIGSSLEYLKKTPSSEGNNNKSANDEARSGTTSSTVRKDYPGGGAKPKSFNARTVDTYEIIRQVGLGTYGEVYKARDKRNGQIVALKKILVHDAKEGYPVTALREMKIMQQLKHKNILRLIEIVPSNVKLDKDDLGAVYMVLEYLDNDLTGILENPRIKLSEQYVKCYMKQLLEGIHYIHTNKVLHRDLKPGNILVSNDSKLMIGDWGLSRSWKSGNRYTLKVVTLWYRAPELLLGVGRYTTAIDMWAVGCIFAELLGRGSILPGHKELEQINLIFNLCGTPTESTWPGVSQTPMCKRVKFEMKESTIDKRFAWMKPDELDLFKRLLTLDPRKRITAAEALDHDYFWKNSSVCNPEDLPSLAGDGLHEFELRAIRRARKEEKTNRRGGTRGGMSRGGSRGGMARGGARGGGGFHRGRPDIHRGGRGGHRGRRYGRGGSHSHNNNSSSSRGTGGAYRGRGSYHH